MTIGLIAMIALLLISFSRHRALRKLTAPDRVRIKQAGNRRYRRSMLLVSGGVVLMLLTPLTGQFLFTAVGLLVMLSPVVVLFVGEYRRAKRND